MSAQSHGTFGDSTLRRVVEYEGPILSPFEIFGDCTQAHLDQNRAWLVPRFQDATSGILIITIQSFLIRRNGLTVLVDACGGNDKERARPHFHRRSWPWLETLRSAGVAPENIDVILCTNARAHARAAAAVKVRACALLVVAATGVHQDGKAIPPDQEALDVMIRIPLVAS